MRAEWPPDKRSTRRWRSRAFVRPLLLTIVGVILSVLLYNVARGPSGCPSDVNADTCGYYFMGAMGRALLTLPVLLVGLLITGFVSGLTSSDRGLALRGVLVGVMFVCIPAGAAIAFGGDPSDTIVYALTAAAFLGVVVLIPIALGFAVGRVVRRDPEDRPVGPGAAERDL